MKRLTTIMSVLVLLSLIVTGCTCPDRRFYEVISGEQNEMESLINDARADAGVPPLRRTILGLVAIDHSKDMACRDFFSHINPDGEDPADRVAEGLGADYAPPYRWIAENIGAGRATAREQFDSWMSSAGHRTNILDDRVDELGLGFVHIPRGSTYRYYWTAIFLGRHSS
jgi:uncharacterized protein YkwD